MKHAEVTRVVLRRWRANPQTCIAILPDLVGDSSAATCSSYERIGQHGACDPAGVMRRTIPADAGAPDVAELVSELRLIGYDPLEIVATLPRDSLAIRRKQL